MGRQSSILLQQQMWMILFLDFWKRSLWSKAF
jgi:hypothetical protein